MIYLDNAATTFPKPKEVYNRVYEVMTKYCANPGRSGHAMALEAGRIIYDSREIVANFFNIEDPMNIAFTSNASEALNMGIKGFLEKGDHVITTTMEHNSILRPLTTLKDRGIIELTIVECDKEGSLDLNKVEDAIQDNTKLIVTTHASNVAGTIFPVEEIGKLAHSRDIRYMVDGAQTAGAYDIDVKKMKIDILGFAGHKSLLGPQGTGGLYVNPEIQLNTIKEGGTGSQSALLTQPEMMPDRLETGTPNTPGIAGLAAGIEYINKIGIDKIRADEEKLAEKFISELRKNDLINIYGPEDFSKRVPVVSINIGEEDSSEIGYILNSAFEIYTRPGLHCAPLAHKTLGTFEQGTVRFSFGAFNTEDEIDKCIDAINEICESVV
ncbi:MAG: aminotransferase class V-fold PLP-dependent enzyme [Andreesenia angusta]|nr:aminotransferase class V-fold PLP-dependent enzyme [Andreesenia angusta]